MTAISGILLAVFQKIPSLLSSIGSAMIISSAIGNKKNRKNLQKRLVGAMSCIDITASLSLLLTNLFIPDWYEVYPWTVGNMTTCRIQGFLLQNYISSIVYNGGLSLYYLLVVRYAWKEKDIQKIEKWFHIIPISVGLVTAIAALALDLYNPANWNCWIAPPRDGDERKTQLAKSLQWLLFYVPLWASIVLSAVNMLLIYLYVRKKEMASSRFSTSQRLSGVVDMKRTKQVAKQGFLFVGAFIATFTLPSIARFMQIAQQKPPNWLIVLAGIFIPSQGFFNAIVYFRLQYSRNVRQHPDKSKIAIIWSFVMANLFPCFMNQSGAGNRGSMTDEDIDIRSGSERKIAVRNFFQNSLRVPASGIPTRPRYPIEIPNNGTFSPSRVSYASGSPEGAGWKQLKKSGIRASTVASSRIKKERSVRWKDMGNSGTNLKSVQEVSSTEDQDVPAGGVLKTNKKGFPDSDDLEIVEEDFPGGETTPSEQEDFPGGEASKSEQEDLPRDGVPKADEEDFPNGGALKTEPEDLSDGGTLETEGKVFSAGEKQSPSSVDVLKSSHDLDKDEEEGAVNSDIPTDVEQEEMEEMLPSMDGNAKFGSGPKSASFADNV